MTEHFSQQSYQVRFDWGLAGLDRLAPADVIVVVDVLRFTSDVSARVAAGEQAALADHADSDGSVIAAAAALGAEVIAGSLRNAKAVADRVAELQHEQGGRVTVSVIAAGEANGDGIRFAVEDQLGAGAVIAAIGDLGIDHSSPEAAAASEGYRALRRGVRHLIGAAGAGRALMADGAREAVDAAGQADADSVAPRLIDGVFTA